MKGQWSGRYTGSDTGSISVTLAEQAHCFDGQASIRSANPGVPALLAGFKTTGKDRQIEFRTPWVAPLHPTTHLPEPWERLSGMFPPGVRVPLYADVTGRWSGATLTLSWTTNLGTHASCVLTRDGAPTGAWARLKRFFMRRSPGAA